MVGGRIPCFRHPLSAARCPLFAEADGVLPGRMNRSAILFV
jgi:hypothetical protein